MIGIVDKYSLKNLGGKPKGEWNFGITDKQKEYVLYYLYGKKKNRSFNPMTPQEFIKNTWKYLEQETFNPVSRKKSMSKLKRKKIKNQFHIKIWVNGLNMTDKLSVLILSG